MSETIYLLTVLYFIFVVEEAEGDQVAAFLKSVFKIDVNGVRSVYANLRGLIAQSLGSINLRPAAA